MSPRMEKDAAALSLSAASAPLPLQANAKTTDRAAASRGRNERLFISTLRLRAFDEPLRKASPQHVAGVLLCYNVTIRLTTPLRFASQEAGTRIRPHQI